MDNVIKWQFRDKKILLQQKREGLTDATAGTGYSNFYISLKKKQTLKYLDNTRNHLIKLVRNTKNIIYKLQHC